MSQPGDGICAVFVGVYERDRVLASGHERRSNNICVFVEYDANNIYTNNMERV